MVKIVVDCFGGDHSPDANIDGALAALAENDDLYLILTGDENIINGRLIGRRYNASRLDVVHAPEVIGCDEKPTDAIRLKKESSMIKGIRMLRDRDDIAAMVSTGSSGALVAGALTRIGRLAGVIRPAFCPILPTMKGGVVGICDSGANLDVTPAHLRQFAIMASLYLQNVYGVKEPRVGLLNVGKEQEKGDDLRIETYKLLSETEEITFEGNMEARELLHGDYDLVVCDGFSGNVLVKSTEGTALELLKKLKKDIMSKTLYKVGALIMKQMFADEKEFMNYQNYGGSVLLGTSKVVVKGHGSSRAVSVQKCIEQAYKMEVSALSSKIEAALAKYEHYELI
jgi:fatty acid/phospholipid synthesis protein PlsX